MPLHIVADENIPLAEAFFADLGTLERRPGRTLTRAHLARADVLLVRSVTPVNAALLADTPVQFVGTCTIGTDHMDLDYLQARGIAWANAPGSNANSVVEYVYAALAALGVDWRQGRVGIIGCGNVGGLLHRRLRAQGVVCCCFDPFLTSADNPDLVPLETVLGCDVVCLHTPLTRTGPHPTWHLLGAQELAQLPRNGVLLNAGRGPVIDNQALLACLTQRPDLRVVLDVWEPEPALSRPLLAKVALGTPHIAGYSYDGKLRGTEMVYQALCRHLGRAPERSLTQLAPYFAPPPLMASTESAAVHKLISRVYAIAEDDRRLRQLAQAAEAGQGDFAEGFDLLRKHYPERREFSNYRVRLQPGDSLVERAELGRWLHQLGFDINPDGVDAGYV